jgi:hypothetical protein
MGQTAAAAEKEVSIRHREWLGAGNCGALTRKPPEKRGLLHAPPSGMVFAIIDISLWFHAGLHLSSGINV